MPSDRVESVGGGLPVQYAMIHFARWSDGQRFTLDLIREPHPQLRDFGVPSRRERWVVLARTEQEAHATVDYHFGRSALWYRLAALQAIQQEST